MRNRAIASLVGILLVTLLVTVGTLVAGNEPLLGLDLQGGISVVLKPTEDVSEERLDEAIEIIRRRIDSLGVAEPEITRLGQTILVQLPGIKDRERALDLVGQTAELRFRPVLCEQFEGTDTSPTTATTAGTVPTTGAGGSTTSTPAPADTTTSAPDVVTTAPLGDGEVGLGAPGESAAGLLSLAQGSGGTTPPTTTAPGATSTAPTTTGAVPGTATTTTAGGASTTTTIPGGAGTTPTGAEVCATSLYEQEITPREADEPEAVVILPLLDDDGNEVSRFGLGPTELTGDALRTANAVIDPTSGQWSVRPIFNSGSPGIDDFNAAAATCFPPSATCPTGQLAIVLDGVVVSAPVIQQASFGAEDATITGSFTEQESKDLALVLKFGALPVELEPQAAQAVSATVGEDALRAGIIAGAIGLALASLYMLAYYRVLGGVAICSLLLSASLLWAVIAFLGETQGLALTLSGVTGIIVSFGISLDSNVVYYEHLKEDLLGGRTLRSSVERSFSSAFSTIVKADVASLIGAFILYWLTIGSVRGFALYLGLATVLDLVASYFFMYPAVTLLARSKRIERNPRLLGLPAGAAQGRQVAGAAP